MSNDQSTEKGSGGEQRSGSETEGGADQREQLKRSEKDASIPQRESFQDQQNDDKIVEIPPIESEASTIKGLDPKK